MPSTRLESGDRAFFELVSRAASVNPFSLERDDLDQRIAEGDAGAPELMERLVGRVEEALARLEEAGSLGPGTFTADDWDLLEHAIMFEAFHRFVDRFDALIEAQRRHGDEPLEVDFAERILSRLVRRGVPRERAVRSLSLMWQMRRAYYFIVHGLTGVSPSMRRLRAAIWNDVFTHDLFRYEALLWNRLEDFSVIVRGETGSGKGQVAAAIGQSGFVPFDEARGRFRSSFTELFVPINLSQFPEGLIESELFGHKKGAFTGAVDSHAGVFSRCSPHGAIFLDEIGEVSIPVQIKLLRVLQDRVFNPVGSHEERRFEGRVIAATHRDLDEARRERRFRDDFYYRLCSDVIEVPPLRERLAETPNELDVLVGHLVSRIVGEPDPSVVASVKEAIAAGIPPGYGWPGNVRELEQCVRRVLLTGSFGPEEVIRGDADPTDRFLRELRSGTLEAREVSARYCALLYERLGTYEEVARVTGLDRRTVRKYVVGVDGDRAS